jgi:TPR repeat protein
MRAGRSTFHGGCTQLLKLLRYGLIGTAGVITLAVLVLMVPSDLSRHLRNQVGVLLYERGQYSLAFTLFERLAEEGSDLGQNNLGVLYERGLGTRRDPSKARGLYERAAEAGLAVAQYNLGRLYDSEDDEEPARAWYERAAAAGDTFAQINLTFLLDDSDGSDVHERRKALLQRAAEAGNVEAQFQLGRALHSDIGNGRAAPADAIRWLEPAAEQGHVEAQIRLSWRYREIDPDKARLWLKRAAEGGQLLAQRDLAEAFLEGDGVQQDFAKAAFWLRKAAFPPPRRQPPPPSEGPALHAGWYTTLHLATHGTPAAAKVVLGDLYLAGLGVARDPSKAAELYRMAAEEESPSGAFKLADLYLEGIGVSRDPTAAVAWYRTAAALGHDTAALKARDVQAQAGG